jgi:muramoyltetrapeptide carboxypeptidase
LKPGSNVAVAAPSGPFDRPSFEKGLAVLAARYQPVVRPDIFSTHRYLAGDDTRRLAELRDALRLPAVFCARGGYGAMRLLPSLTPSEFPALPLVGFSDITALHAGCALAGHRSAHAPVLTQLGNQPAEVVERLWALLEHPGTPAPLQGTGAIGSGTASGPLLGGNLSVLTRLIGTPWLPPLDGAVLLVEDVGERPYRLDRMLMHLKLSGALARLAGFALGDFTGCDEKEAAYGPVDVVSELIAATGKPCVLGLPIGHGAVNQPVPLGAQVRLQTATSRLEFLEGLVA